MENQMNRRNWIRSSALLAGSMALFSGEIAAAASGAGAPVIAEPSMFSDFMSEQEFQATIPVTTTARLSANENPFGPSPKAKQAIAEGIDTSFRYGFNQRELISKISQYEGLSNGMVALSPGSTPFLKAGAQHFAKDGSIICGALTYDDLPGAAARMGGKVVMVPMTADYKLDLDAMEKAIDGTTKLVYIVNPNNPTATTVDRVALKAFCERVSPKVPVLIDEAYIDYVDDPASMTCIDCVKKGMNVIVIRTFSKLYGFAGLRMGYMVAQPAMVNTLSKYIDGSFSISALSMNAAVASYQDKVYMADVVAKAKESKKFLYDTLKKEGYDYIPSDANFVLFPIKMEKNKFMQELGKRNVSIRTWSHLGKDYARVSIGTMDEMKIFADAFSQIA